MHYSLNYLVDDRKELDLYKTIRFMQKILTLFIVLILAFGTSCRKRNGCTNECASNFSSAKNDDGSCEFVKPVIDYTSHFVNNCKPPYGVNFHTAVNNISCKVKYDWSFGDGGTSSEQYPYHIFTASGSYLITLRTTNETEVTTKQFNIVLDTLQAIVSQFYYTGTNNNYHIPAKVTFSNTSQFAGTFSWNFGDGFTSTNVDPEHIYTVPGTYTVTLKSSCGSKEANYTKTITILPKPTIIALTKLKVSKGKQILSSDKGTPIYLEMLYDNSSKMFSKAYLFKTYPMVWQFPTDIATGTYKASDIFLDPDFLSFRIWLDEITANDLLLFDANVDFKYLSDRYYPMIVNWDNNGYAIEATLNYQ